MLRIARFIGLQYYLILLCICTTTAQSGFNLDFHKDFGCTNIDMLHEDSNYYYTIGYAQANDKVEVGVMVNKHDKMSGSLIHTAYFDVAGVWLSVGARTGVKVWGENLYFCVSGRGVVYVMNYNTLSQNITVKDSVVTNSGFVYDLVMDDKGNMYCSYTTKDNDEKSQGTVTKFKTDGTKSHYTIDNKGMIHSGGKLLKKDSDSWYFIAQWIPSFYDNYLVVAELDSAFNILWKWKSPWADRIYGVRNVLSINNDQVLILASGVTTDPIYNEEAFVHWVYRYDLKERKVLWRRNYGQPPSSYITPGGKIVPSQKDSDAFLLCTSAVLEGSSPDFYVIAGRAAKFKANGDALWIKDYVLYQDEHFERNRFVTMIPTMDGNYLLGGFYHGDGCRSWLVKINEDGHIVPRDTLSSVSEDIITSDEFSKIQVYPNPVSDVLYISQTGRKQTEYKLLDMNGAVVKSIYAPGADTEIMWDVSSLPSGIYVLVASSQGQMLGNCKLVKM